MLRTSAALLLLTAFVTADEPLQPAPAGPSLNLHPMSDPAMSPLPASPHAVETLPQAPTTAGSPSPQIDSSGPVYSSEIPVYSGGSSYSGTPVYSNESHYAADPFISGAAPLMSTTPAAGCACQGGTAYSAGAIGVPAAMPAYGSGYFDAGVGLGYDALGYAGGTGGYTGAFAGGMHVRHPYYSYRRPWYANGPMSHNVTIAW